MMSARTEPAAAGHPGTSAESSGDVWNEALAALAHGATETIARFRYDVVTDSWWWSPGLYALHGYAPGEVEPSTELLMAHKHDDDRVRTKGTLRAVLATGEPFCCRHRIVDATGQVHIVLSVGEGTRDGTGTVVAVQGYFIDLTAPLREVITGEAIEAVAGSAATRAVIEQAKGMLIAIYRLDAHSAFELLVWSSQQSQTKVTALAAGLVQHFAEVAPDDMSPAWRAGTYLGLLPGGR